ncbi:MAG: sulfotransferase, partial [Pseudomonadota bacterium]
MQTEMPHATKKASPKPAIADADLSADAGRKPNLFVIGASKAGSSALHSYLRWHPDICMSTEKEPCYFVDDDELSAAWPIMARRPCSHDWEAYLSLWEGGEDARYRGEGSVYYSQTPHRSGVPGRIAQTCPDARIVYLVREPVQRAVTHYWQRFKEFQEDLPIETAMREHAIYRDTSDYALQLQAYLDHFEPSQIRVIVAEDLRTRRRQEIDALTDWLDLPRGNYADDTLKDVHRSPPTSRRQRFPFVARVRNSALWALARPLLPSSVVSRLRQGATVRFDKSEVDESGARAFLTEYL